ncbi:MAG TPA: O-antigen ligase family protein [Anaerolineales bacterium]|nr:O-antigen ligase family protein [Anaerolineales bacterium]
MTSSTTPLAMPVIAQPGSQGHGALWAWSLDLLVGVGLAYLAVIGLSPYVFWPTSFSVVSLGLFAALVVTWLIARARGQVAALGRTPIAAMLYLAVAALAVSQSIAPAVSQTVGWQALVFVTAFLLLADLFSGPNQERAVNIVLWAGVLAMLWHWAQVAGWYGNWLALNPGVWVPTIPFRLPNPNPAAQQLTLLLLAAVYRLATGRGLQRWAMAPYLVSLGALLFLTSSRGGWLGAAAGLVALAAFWLNRASFASNAARVAGWLRGHRALAAFGGILLLAALASASVLIQRQLEQPSRGGRFEYWLPALETFLAHPVWGQGPGTYAITYMRAQQAPPAVLFHQAHSVYFNTLAEAGLLGLIAGGLFIGAIAAAQMRRLADDRSGVNYSAALSLAVLVAFLVHSGVDTLTFDKGNVLIMAVLVASGFAAETEARRGPRALRAALPGALALAVLGFGVYGIWRDGPAHDAIAATATNDGSAAVSGWASAVEREPGSAAVWQQLGLAQARQAAADGSPLADAVASFEEAYRLDPHWPANALNLGALTEAEGDLTTASHWYEQAVRLAPRVAFFRILLGRALEAQGLSPEAEAAYAVGLELQPSFATATFWQETAFRREVLHRWSESTADDPGPTWALATHRGVSDLYLMEAEHALEAGDLALADYWLGMADLGFWAEPTARLRWGWRLAELEALRGNAATAIDLADRVFALADDPSSFGPGTVGGSIYGTFVALRPTVDAEFVPQVFDLGATVDWPERRALALTWCAALAPDSERPALCNAEIGP